MSKMRFVRASGLLVVLCIAFHPSAALAFEAKRRETASLASKEFFKPELHLSSSNVLVEESVLEGLSNREAWDRFLENHGRPAVFLDPRSGIPSNIILSLPLIPGAGEGNRVKLEEVGISLGLDVDRIDGKVVGDLILAFVVTNREALRVDAAQLGRVQAEQAAEELWHVNIPQWVNGIPVRHSRISASISHGNLVLLGAETWGNVNLDTRPKVTADQALALGFEYVGGKARKDDLWKKPELEIVPVTPAEFQSGEAFSGPMGAGYRHRLVWSFGFRRQGEDANWEVLVDAQSGEVLAFEDKNLYEAKRINGGVYPLASTGVCPSNDRCGVMQQDAPMPFANTGLPAPNNFTDSAGVFDYPGSGTVTTTLAGRYVWIGDGCGPVSQSASGDVLLGGVNGQHDCTSAGSSPGNTPAARSAFYEVNKLAEQARGWLPANTWLQSQISSNVNLAQTCNAFYSPGSGSINFYRSGNGCRNTGEIAAVLDHEWGHGMDHHDTGGALSNSSETYADIAAIYRLQTSCLGYGFFWTADDGCGMTSDGTGFNNDESQTAAPHCDIDCSGTRGADWDRHEDHNPDTPSNFVCVLCASGSGPCGRQVHCEAAPGNQAAYDFAARDLTAPPFNMSVNDAFIVANKVFYQGSGNIGSWETCTCPSTSNGCGATNAYMQWLAADDDDGNLANGTPHMTALFAAFNRHAIACATPTPVNGGCAGAPTTAPNLTVSVGSNQISLSWPPVPGAVTYRVLRSEGYAGCDFGKAVLAEVAGTSYTDPGVANGRPYSYVVQAVGSSSACFGPGSTCVTATPQSCAASVSLARDLYNCTGGTPLNIALADADLAGSGSQSVTVISTTEPGPETTTLVENPTASGVFTGTFATTGAPPTPGDGAVSVSNGDTITVGFVDVSYCGVPNVSVTRTAAVDCVGPAISFVRAENITGSSASVKWDTNEASSSQVTYGPAPPPGTSTPVVPVLVTGHTVEITELLECRGYVYSVSSTDAAGNTVFADNGGAYFSFATGRNVNPTFPSPSPPVAIPDNTTVLATVNVPDLNVVADADVRISITHTYTGDLDIFLVGPNGTRVELSSDNGGSGGNFQDTTFDDEAAGSITSGVPPFTGSFRPEGSLATLDGIVATGTWTLEVTDDAGDNTGAINAFDLILTYPPQACGAHLKYQSHTLTEACNGTGGGGGNGVAEPGETVTIPVRLENDGTVGITGITATLTSPTPGVTVTVGSAAYPDLAEGQSAPGGTPFEIQVDPSVACQTTIQLDVGCSSNEGSWTGGSFTVPVGSDAFATTEYVSTDVPKPLLDPGTITSSSSVASTAAVLDVNVGVTLTHTYDADLVLTLIAPNGTRIKLAGQRGGNGDNFTGTIFDDEAATPISGGIAPFTGSFRPEVPLSGLDGISAAGTWTLEVRDVFAGDTGTLTAWSMTLYTTAPPECNVCTPAPPPPGEVVSLLWSGTGRDTLEWSSAPGALDYRLYRGDPVDLPFLLDANTDSCERLETAGLSSGAILTEAPSQHAFHWFLVRGANGTGLGPAGNATAGPRSQDASGTCP